ncbi:RNA-directed DNA polymerase [Pseudoalteromonas sp. PA2MD11]|uniref:RNA-directed DNA polymerase n=1 Tax=Pseudoalteromonas sp. PA2MD11 TaxID=2785057 RepID=UPI001ADFC8A7|nr:reverse transcriptase domain-containing protein [Pseudoalteromonas sp. PA2MD11]
MLFKKYGNLICKFLATDQHHYVAQQSDGSYLKKAGFVNPKFIENVLKNKDSIAIYQKNIDSKINWICFDFDILKKCIESNNTKKGEAELERVVSLFVGSIKKLEIPFLIEYSGRRGFHIWVTFEKPISYQAGYKIQQAILSHASVDFDSNLVGLDLFPQSASPSGGLGKGVKIPLSKHKVSGNYSYLLSDIKEVKNTKNYNELNDDLIQSNIEVLEQHNSTSQAELGRQLEVFFEFCESESIQYNRVKSISIHNKGFDLEDVLTLWEESKPLQELALKINRKESLNNLERVLLVGIFGNISSKKSKTFAEDILHKIFSSFDNYNRELTSKAIASFKGFNFPSQEQIENIVKAKFGSSLSLDILIKKCIPNVHEYESANFDYSIRDVEVTRAAELQYLYLNDEVQCKVVIDELSLKSSMEFSKELEAFLKGHRNWSFYKHLRNEDNKERELVTLSASTRVCTSTILKQIAYFLDIKNNDFSHGYQISQGYSGGYIFKQWLYLWLKFIKNITEAIEDECFYDYYIVKTDIEKFYDKIPHDTLKRVLLGGSEGDIKSKILTMSDSCRAKYKKCIDFMFNLTEDIVGKNVGLPQGPAYARYFAELYLNSIDRDFIDFYSKGDVYLYQRYVDDIFFIAKSKSEAEKFLAILKSKLEILSLNINEEKTIVSKISSFYQDFNEYRSQSKYTIDQVSKSYDTSSDKKKNSAINEFVTLMEADSCQDDLSFIFSHLDGVRELDDLKTEKILPALTKGVGRGSLYKNLFNFIFEFNQGWEVIYEVPKYDALQSEVLTSSLITALELNKDKKEQLLEVAIKVQPQLTFTDLVEEHVASLIVKYGCEIPFNDISPMCFIKVAVSSDHNVAEISNELLPYLNTYINGIKSFTDFVKVIYYFSFSDKVTKDGLEKITSMFFAKMSLEMANSNFEHDKVFGGIVDLETTSKFYFLLCIFSSSNIDVSEDVISGSWKYCVSLFNKNENVPVNFIRPNWLDKLSLVSLDMQRANWIVSSIVDGCIFRGESDNLKVFENYHNSFLVYLALNDQCWKSNNKEIEEKLNLLKEKSEFYKWLIEPEDVKFFPDNKKWFERNIIENGVTALKKDNVVLIRKESNDFLNTSPVNDSENGFSELKCTYNKVDLIELREHLKDATMKGKISYLIKLLADYNNGNNIPMIFLPERVLCKEKFNVFSNELTYHSKLIVERGGNEIITFDNNKENLITCFFIYFSDFDGDFSVLLERYFNKLDKDIDKVKLITKFNSNLILSEEESSCYYQDMAMASALFLNYLDLSKVRQVEAFMNQYQKFFSLGVEDVDKMHIFGVRKGMVISDQNPKALLETIIDSLSMSRKVSHPESPFYLDKNIEAYLALIEEVIDNSDLKIITSGVESFELSEVSAQLTARQVKINSESYSFEDVKIINLKSMEITPFTIANLSLINTSDHIYSNSPSPGVVYLITMNSHISTMFFSVKKRYEEIIDIQKRTQSYPEISSDSIVNSIKYIDGFSKAVKVISHHRDFLEADAENVLAKWLLHIPEKFREPLINLIQAHEYMKLEEVDNFIKKVDSLDCQKDNIFLMKSMEDFNGTQRILYKNPQLGRKVKKFNPFKLNYNHKRATLIADLILSGSQVSNAFLHYLTKEVSFSSSLNHFKYTESERNALFDFLKSLDTLDIYTVLYTKEGIERIQLKLRAILNNNITLNVLYGREISENAYFGSSQKLSEKNKSNIRKIFTNKDELSDLYDHFHFNGQAPLPLSITEIDELDLVTRYKSLPKMSFGVLKVGLKADHNCKPFEIIPELD